MQKQILLWGRAGQLAIQLLRFSKMVILNLLNNFLSVSQYRLNAVDLFDRATWIWWKRWLIKLHFERSKQWQRTNLPFSSPREQPLAQLGMECMYQMDFKAVLYFTDTCWCDNLEKETARWHLQLQMKHWQVSCTQILTPSSHSLYRYALLSSCAFWRNPKCCLWTPGPPVEG